MAGKLLEVELNVQETHIAAQSQIKAITLASGSRIERSRPYWKGETEPHTTGTKFRIYDLFLRSHKNKSPLGNLWHIDQMRFASLSFYFPICIWVLIYPLAPFRDETSCNSSNTLVTPVGTITRGPHGGQVARGGINRPGNRHCSPVPY